MTALPSLRSATSLAIDAALDALAPDPDSETLRCSGIGETCERRLWLAFRWAHEPWNPDARLKRIFKNGHDRETRLVEMLKLAGIDLQDRNPETGEQWRVSLASGFLAGSCDGIATGVPEAPVTPHLVEIKTMNKARWDAWRRKGVQESDPKYFVQMQLYMLGLNLTRALFVAENQDSKEIETQRVEFDPVFAAGQEARAERIALSDAAPERISDDPDSWSCRYCPAREVCFGLAEARRNCRTCLAACVSEGGWGCARHGVDLSAEDQRKGCAVHLYKPNLVPGEQIDADETACTVTYRMPDGSVWVDGPQPRLDAEASAA